MPAPQLKRIPAQTPAFISPRVDGAGNPVPTALFPLDVGMGKDAFWFQVSVMDMGNNSRFLVGDKTVQTDGMFSITDFWLYDCPEGFCFDASKYYIISDVDNSGYVAVSGMFVPFLGITVI